MTIAVTDAMIDAAQREFPGMWNRARVRRALRNALALIPGDEIKVAAAVSVHFTLDERQMRSDVLAAVEGARELLPLDLSGRLDLASLRTLVGTATVTEPMPPLPEFGGAADIARRLGVARSTVSGWIKNRDSNGMPGPATGLDYDLDAVEAWHREWKQAPADGA